MALHKSSFIGSFKLGDNINYNLKILEGLYSFGNNIIFNKPKTIFIITIIEAILYDFFLKTQLFTREGVKNIPNEVLVYLRNKKLDKFNHYIQSLKKHNFLHSAGNEIYDHLDDLRKLRDRIHIQNEKIILKATNKKFFLMKEEY